MEMEKVKDPAMLVACVSLLSSVGGGTYFYKQLEAIRMEQERMTNQLAKLTERVALLEVSNNGRQESVAQLNNQIKELNHQINAMPRLDTIATQSDLDVFDRDFDELIFDLQEQNIEVNRASKESQSRLSGRYSKRHSNRKENEDIGKGRRPKTDDRVFGRTYNEPKTPLYQSVQPQYQGQNGYNYQQYQQGNYQGNNAQNNQGGSQQVQVLQPQILDDNDDLDIINHVRKQHG